MLLRLFTVLKVYFQHMLVRITQAPNGADLRFLTPSLQQPSSWQVIDALADCTARGFNKDISRSVETTSSLTNVTRCFVLDINISNMTGQFRLSAGVRKVQLPLLEEPINNLFYVHYMAVMT